PAGQAKKTKTTDTADDLPWNADQGAAQKPAAKPQAQKKPTLPAANLGASTVRPVGAPAKAASPQKKAKSTGKAEVLPWADAQQ
ncbi:MAG: hypothetical protein ABL897_08690, partial [Hyphomicrobium sp.]